MPGPLGRSVLLPQAARIDLADTASLIVGTTTAGLVRLHVVDSSNFEIPLSVVINLSTSATVSARVPVIIIQDADANTLYQVMANGYQAESQAMRHLFYVDAGSSYFAGNANSVTPLPYILLQPGYRMFFQTTNFQAADQLLGIAYTYQSIPTGPEPAGADFAPPPVLA